MTGVALKEVVSKDGLKLLDQLRQEWLRDDVNPLVETKVVGSFGIIHADGFEDRICFVVSHRKDRRHGVVGRKAPTTEYGKSLMEAVFRKWQ